MMDMLAEYVKSLAVFMIFASVCQIVMPEGKFKGAISLVTGIMLMLVILKPVNAVINNGDSYIKNSIRLNTYAAENELQQYGADEVQMVIDNFQTACEEMLLSELNADRVEVIAKNGDDGIYIDYIAIYKAGVTESVKHKTAKLCGISEDKISVINGEGDEYNETN